MIELLQEQGRSGQIGLLVGLIDEHERRRALARERTRRWRSRGADVTLCDAHKASQELARVSDYASLVRALTARRKALGMTQLDLDERAGFQDGYAGKLEIGYRPGGRTVGAVSLPLWLEALGVRLAVVPVDK